jgi:diaminopimelate decarboxylase
MMCSHSGPCCFAGDLAARERTLPRAYPGDVIAILDVGGYYHSSYSFYNLRQAPPVYLFNERTSTLTLVRAATRVAETLEFMQCL